MLLAAAQRRYKRKHEGMDKSTKTPHAREKPASPAELLLRAIESAAGMRAGHVIIGRGDPGWTPPTIRLANPERHRYGTGLHTHALPEVCIVVEGRAAMEVEGSIYRFEAPSVALLTPGTEHSELFVNPESSYRLLWLSVMGDSMVAVFSVYRGKRQWEVERISPLQGPLAARLRSAGAVLKPGTPGAVDRLRCELLPVLAEFYRFEVVGRARAPEALEAGAGSAGRVTQLVDRARSFIDAHFHQPIDVAVIAELTAMSPNYLNTLFSKQMGMGIKAYLIKQRMDHAMTLCQTPGMMMKQVALAVGYQDPLYFSRVFRSYHGITPTEARGRAERGR